MRYAIIVGVILVALPLLLRITSPEPYPDAASYEQLRISENEEKTRAADYLYALLPGQLVLIVCAALTLLLMGFVYDDEVFLLLLAASPVFIKTFTTVGPAAPAIAVISLGVLLAHKNKYWSVLVVPLSFMFGFSLGVLATITIIVIAMGRNLPFIALGASFFALVSATLTSVLSKSFNIGFISPDWNDFLGIVGEGSGVTIFAIFLALLGFMLELSEQPKPSMLIMLLIIPCSIFFEHGLIILAALLAFYGAKALRFLALREWHFEELRAITLLLIACGLLFSVVVVEKERLSVNEGRVELIRFISAAYPKGTLIAADESVAPILRYHGYNSRWPSDNDLSSGDLTEQGYRLVVTQDSEQTFTHLPIIYKGKYSAYEVSDE